MPKQTQNTQQVTTKFLVMYPPAVICAFTALWWMRFTSEIILLDIQRPKQFISSVQFISVAQLCPTLCDPMKRSTPGLPVHHQLLELTQTHVHWIGDAIQLSHPLSSPSPPATIFPSITVFSNESALCIRWLKNWSFTININPSNDHPGLISFTMDWLDLLAVQGTLKSLLETTVQKHQFLCAQLPL